MDFRADLYAAGARFQRTERFDAADVDAAKDTARQLLAEHGVDYAVVYTADGQGRTEYVAMVGAKQ